MYLLFNEPIDTIDFFNNPIMFYDFIDRQWNNRPNACLEQTIMYLEKKSMS